MTGTESTNIFNALHNNRYTKYYVVILTLISVIFWNISLIQAKSVSIGDYGLFSVLPWTFYAGFFMLLAAILFNVFFCKNQEGLFKFFILIQLFILVAFIFFTPAIVETTPRAFHSWIKYGYTDYIVRNEQLFKGLVYHNWPVPFIFSAEFQLITSIEGPIIPLIMPLIIDVMIFSVITLFFYKLFSDIKKRVLGIVLFYLIIWVNQFHFAPQIFAVLLFLILLYLIYFHLPQFKIRYLAVMGIFFFTLVMTHLLTTLVASMFIGLVLLHIFYQKYRASKEKKKDIKEIWTLKKLKYPVFIAIICGVILLWFSYAESWVNYVNWNFDPELLFKLTKEYMAKISKGTDAHSTVVVIRMIFSVVIAILALIGGYLAYKKEKRRVMFLLLISGIIPIFLFEYGVEIVQRAFLFCSLPLAVLIGIGIDRKKFLTLVVTFSFIAVPLHILSMYGNEKIDYTPPTHIKGAHFFFDHTSDGNIIGISVERSEYIEIYKWTKVSDLANGEQLENDTYFLNTSTLNNHLRWYHGKIGRIESINNATKEGRFIKIYSSPDAELYKLS